MHNNKLNELCNLLNLDKFSLIDVGAAGGFDNRWKVLGDRLFVIGFEPGEKEFRILNKENKLGNVKYYNYCLADKSGRLTFFVCKKSRNASCLKPNYKFIKRFPFSERFDLSGEVSVDANTLDNTPLAKEADFIKIDTEGYELNILKGAVGVLNNACGLEVEVEFCGLHEEQRIFSEVDIYLRGLGFSLFDLRPAYWKRNIEPQLGRGQIVFADALYLKDYINVGSLPVRIGPAIVTAIVYKKYDFAAELIDYFYQKGRVEPEKRDKLQVIISSLSKPLIKISDFKGKQKIISSLEKITELLKSPQWARYDCW